MRWRRLPFFALVAAACGPVACGTDAVGVDDCRNIEVARCKAAQNCDFGIDGTSDENVCQRFARDNCLHGLVVQPPTAGAVTSCVNSITAAGTCAATAKNVSECPPATLNLIGTVTKTTATVCQLIENPEQISACAFLTQTPAPAPAPTTPKDSGAGG